MEKKYGISPEMEIYHGASLGEQPYLKHTILFYEGFLQAGIHLPLSELATSFFNFTGKAPQ